MSLTELQAQIREYINIPRRQHGLLQRRGDWLRLCSAPDVVGDTDAALDAYLEKGWPSSHGANYILVYGALQTLFVQQDAVAEICRVIGSDFSRGEDLEEIRRVRAASVGHPTNIHGGYVGFISRATLKREGFQLAVISGDHQDDSHPWVDIPALIALQREQLGNALREVCDKLSEDEKRHKEHFREKRLATLFPSSLSYIFQKINEAILREDSFPAGGAHVNMIADMVAALKSGLNERGELEGSSLAYEFSTVEYPISELSAFFADRESAYLNPRAAMIFVDFVEHQLQRLMRMAQDIDADYAADPT